MKKLFLAAFLTLLVFQSIDCQNINVVKSNWAFSGFTISTSWSVTDITKFSNVSTNVIQLKTSTLTSMIVAYSILGIQASTSSKTLTSISKTVKAMQVQTMASNLTTLNALISEQTINLAQTSCTNLAYILLRIESSCVGRSIIGSPEVIDGYDMSYPDPQNLTTVGAQAQAVNLFQEFMPMEVSNYCQQFFDLSKTVEVNCSICPTEEQCNMVIDKWQIVSTSISDYENSTVKATNLIRSVSKTVRASLIDALNSTNILIVNMRECSKCLNTGCTKNQAVAFRPCDRRKNNGSLSSSDRKEYCRQKASSSARRHSRNNSRARKGRKRKSTQRERKMMSNNRKHWKKVNEKTELMETNFDKVAKSSKSKSSVRNEMINYSSAYGIFIKTIFNLTEEVSESATNISNAATEISNEKIREATKAFNVEIYNFTSKVLTDNYESCLNFSNDARNLLFEYLNEVSKCDDAMTQFTQQIFVNISIAFTAWIEQINYFSNCHDKCVAVYCPFVKYRSTTSYKGCFFCKRYLPKIYNNETIKSSYKNCNIECSTEMQMKTLNISGSAQLQIEINEVEAQNALEMVQKCVDLTLANYQQKLSVIRTAYDACAPATTTTSTTSTSTTSTTTEDPTTTTSTSTTVDPYVILDQKLSDQLAALNNTISQVQTLLAEWRVQSIQSLVDCYNALLELVDFVEVLVKDSQASLRTLPLADATLMVDEVLESVAGVTGTQPLSECEDLVSTTTTTVESTSTSTTTTVESSSTSTSTTQTTTTLAPCGTFVAYDQINAPNDPITKGFAGGFNLQNITAYVAHGNVSCNNQMPLPGHIVVNPPTPKKSGVYVTCNTGEKFSETTGLYLLNHPNLVYVPANSTNLWNIPGTLKINSTSYVFCYGRFFYGGRYVLGKVRNTDATGKASTMFYNTPGGEVSSSTYEVLTCKL